MPHSSDGSLAPDLVVDDRESSVPEVASQSPGRLAWQRFRNDRKTVAAGWVVIVYVLLAILAPILVNFGVLDPFTVHQELIGPDSLPIGPWGGVSWDHPFGVEPGIGRDVLSRVWFGLTFSLTIAAVASTLSIIIGVTLGIIAAMGGRWADMFISWLIDLMMSFPQQLMLLALSSVFLGVLTGVFLIPEGDPARAVYVVLVMAIFGWMGSARLIRGQVFSLREREFIDAARLMGASRRRLWFREVLPNLWAPILVTFTIMLPAYISTEAALAFLGISIMPPTPTLGNVMGDSLRYATADFLYFILPAFFLVVIVVAFNLLGDGLRDALDPKGSR